MNSTKNSTKQQNEDRYVKLYVGLIATVLYFNVMKDRTFFLSSEPERPVFWLWAEPMFSK